jgi:hypothetical protein
MPRPLQATTLQLLSTPCQTEYIRSTSPSKRPLCRISMHPSRMASASASQYRRERTLSRHGGRHRSRGGLGHLLATDSTGSGARVLSTATERKLDVHSHCAGSHRCRGHLRRTHSQLRHDRLGRKTRTDITVLAPIVPNVAALNSVRRRSKLPTHRTGACTVR